MVQPALAMLASYMSTGLSPGGSTFLVRQLGKKQKMVRGLGPCHPEGDLNWAPGSRFQPAQSWLLWPFGDELANRRSLSWSYPLSLPVALSAPPQICLSNKQIYVLKKKKTRTLYYVDVHINFLPEGCYSYCNVLTLEIVSQCLSMYFVLVLRCLQ